MSSLDNPSLFMKGPKRKRLAKACDACHKSKRRCDGTAPCSNCYYASKQCTYTDAAGRPVPAPRSFKVERQDQQQASSSTDPRNFTQSQFPSSSASNQFRIYASQSSSHYQNDNTDDDHKHARKRFRNERGNPMPVDDFIIDGPISSSPPDRPNSIDLDPALTCELTNLFFAHCHPARAVLHKPTFSTALSHNRVPSHLLLAVCAVAAPLSKQPRIRTTPARFAGKPLAEAALSQMFDSAGRLVVEPDLAAAQALCILQMHDILTKDKGSIWSSRFHDLALQIVEGLGVHSPDHPTLTPVPSPEFIQRSIEREAIRRIFWLIHLLDLIASIYFKKPVTFTDSELRLRLPVDETSFELGVHSTLPEYLYLPAVRMQYGSEFGHLIRIVTIFAKMEHVLDELNDPKISSNPIASLNEAEQKMDEWDRTLPDHLRFSEQSLQVQQSMFETSSNTGAWCWCMLHVYHASCALALNFVRQWSNGQTSRPFPQWAVERIDLILQMLGDRAKNSVLLGCALWTLVKYCKRDDSQVRRWASDYEEHWGTKVFELVQDWRSQPSPIVQHQYPAHPHPQPPPPLHVLTQNQPRETSRRRLSDVRGPGQHNFSNNPSSTNNSRPPTIQRRGPDAPSYNPVQLKRSTSNSPRSPVLYPSGQSTNTLNTNNSSSRSLGTNSDNKLPDITGNKGGSVTSVSGIGPLMSHSGDSVTGKHSTGRDQISSRWSHIGGVESSGADGGGTALSETPLSRYSGPTTSNSTGSGTSGTLDRGPNHGVEDRGSVAFRGNASGEASSLKSPDAVQSLPSLKASGLLDSWSSSWKNGSIEIQLNGAGSSQHQTPQILSTSPRRTTPPGLGVLNLPSVSQVRPLKEPTDLRSSTLQAVPVGLAWLAKESR